MPVKIVQYWNVEPRRQEEFDDFLKGEFIPGLADEGLMQVVGAWHVASGEGPYFVCEIMSETVAQVDACLMGANYLRLRGRLLDLVTGFRSKLLIPTGRVENQPIELQTGYKFNQHFNINADDYYSFVSFVKRVHLDSMQSFGLTMVGGWYVVVGATPYVIAEGRADDLTVIGRMLQNPRFKEVTQGLLEMVSGYGCKVLVPSGHLNQ